MDDTDEPPAKSEADQRLELFTYSYEQVLDATKHQDDKIGRILTAISFLTAAVLALAAFGQTRMITTVFNLGTTTNAIPVSLPMVFLTCYLLGIVFAVVQLINSLSTPLRLPGLADGAGKDVPLPPSTVYFHEIEKNSREEWWEIATTSSPAAMRADRTRSLIVETRNLATRTTFKYHRTNEATAIVTWSLIALLLCVTTVALVALSYYNPLAGEQQISIPGGYRMTARDVVMLATVFAGVVLLWFAGAIRYQRLGRDVAKAPLVVQWVSIGSLTLAIFLAVTGGTWTAVTQRPTGSVPWALPVWFYAGVITFLAFVAGGCLALNFLLGPDRPAAGDIARALRRLGRLAVAPIVLMVVVSLGTDGQTVALGVSAAAALAVVASVPGLTNKIWPPSSADVQAPEGAGGTPGSPIATDSGARAGGGALPKAQDKAAVMVVAGEPVSEEADGAHGTGADLAQGHGGHSGERAKGPKVRNCDLCDTTKKEWRETASARITVLILLAAGLLSVLASRLTVDGAIVWPLVAAFSVVTLFAITSALQSTISSMKEARNRDLRQKHNGFFPPAVEDRSATAG